MPIRDDAADELEPLARGRGSSVGRYLLLDVIGAGGMGIVYKAYDPELGRPIALKLLVTDEASDTQRDRLLREAQALARLQHPNVVAVHDVGTFEGDVFIAMEFVEGDHARSWVKAKPRGRREILDVFLAAGEGLAAAHRAGLVHRDFKPDNVLVGNDGRVRVLDFGLARATNSLSGERAPGPAPEKAATPTTEQAAPDEVTSAARRGPQRPRPPVGERWVDSSPPPSESGRRLLATPLTRADAIVGTPRFMSPEQHMGDPVDEAADQFSFCVSLYWALYGVFPFEDAEAMLLQRIGEPPAGATVPRWLRLVLLKGLSSRASQRYPSMEALLAALRADPAELWRRRLRPVLAVVAAAALVSAVIAGALAYKARRGAAEQALLAQQFGQEVEKISSIERYASLLPLHDTRPEREAIRARMNHLSSRMQALGPLAAGPGHHALGRGQLALERYEDALVELEAAWATGYRAPDLAYALGLTHGRLYQRAINELRKSGDEKRDSESRAAIARAHGEPALRYLKLAEAHELAVDAPEYVEGLIALYEHRYDEALTLARKAGRRVSWLYEAHTLEGDIQLSAGEDRYWKGEVDGALERFRLAGEAYLAAAQMAPSDAAARLGECEQQGQIVDLQVDRDQSPEESVERQLAACEAAARIRPDEAAPLAAQAGAWHARATYQKDHGVDPTASEQRTIELAGRALALDAKYAQAHTLISSAANDLARRQIEFGGDPRAWLERAIEHARRSLELTPSSGAYSHLSMIFRTRAEDEQNRGLDPRGSYREAIEAGQKSLSLAPEDFGTWNAIGLGQLFLGQWQLGHGDDPTEALTRAIEAFDKVAHITPKLDYGYVNRCEAERNLAELELKRGAGDPLARLDHAIEGCRQAIALDGNYVGSQWDLGAALVDVATFRLEHGDDPADAIGKAGASLDRALQIDGTYSLALASLAELRLVEARLAARGKRDPGPAFSRAAAVLERALKLSNGKSVDALRLSAELHRRRAEWAASLGRSTDEDVRQGLAMAARALERDPRLSGATEAQDALRLLGAHANK
jgi:serine/threonine protein kinase